MITLNRVKSRYIYIGGVVLMLIGCAEPPGDSSPLPDSPTGGFAEQLLSLVNASRTAGATCGNQSMPSVGPVTYNNKLNQAALGHSEDMSRRGYFSHTSPDGRDPGDRLKAVGYRFFTWGENIAMGARSPESVHQRWMKSAGHCRNIMNGRFKEMGIGYVQNGHLWTQVFGISR